MGGIGLCGEVAGGVFAAQADAEAVDVDVGTHLGEESHALGVVDFDVVEGGADVVGEEQGWGRTIPRAEGKACAWDEAWVFPRWGVYVAVFVGGEVACGE